MTTVPPPLNPVLSWPCLQADPVPPPSKSNPQSKTTESKQQKTFAQAVSNICDIPLIQLPKPCIKGDDRAIQIPDDEYEAGLEDCKHNLHGRIIWPKGSDPITVENFRIKLSGLWKDMKRWGVTSIGKGYYEFSFSSIEDMRRVRSISSWNLNPGLLKLFAWSKDFSPNIQQQATTQVWIRIFGLSQEYWRKKILFAIANGVGTPICTDNITSKSMLDRSFGHYARVLVDLNLNDALCHRILVERTGYAFFVDVEYENLPDFCSFCKCTGHYYEICKRKPVEHNENVKKNQAKRNVQNYAVKKNKEPEPQEAGQHEVEKTDAIVQASRGSKIIVDEDPLIIDIIRSREMATTIHVEDAIKIVEETSSISVETLPVHIVQVEDTLALAETYNGNQQSNSFADMRIIGPWCDAVTDMDYAQQTMDFLSDSWTNMGQQDQLFQLVVPRKKKSKKQQSEASKGFKVGSSSRSQSHY